MESWRLIPYFSLTGHHQPSAPPTSLSLSLSSLVSLPYIWQKMLLEEVSDVSITANQHSDCTMLRYL